MPGKITDPKDPFGFNAAYPTGPKVDWEPDPDLVPQAGKIKDPRFNKDPEAGRHNGGNRHGAVSNVYVRPRTYEPVELGAAWPKPETRATVHPRDARPATPVSLPSKAPATPVSARPDVVTSPAGKSTSNVVVSPSAYVPPHLRNRATNIEVPKPSTQVPSAVQANTAVSTLMKPPVMVKSRPGPGAQYRADSNSSDTLLNGTGDADADAVVTRMQLEEYGIDVEPSLYDSLGRGTSALDPNAIKQGFSLEQDIFENTTCKKMSGQSANGNNSSQVTNGGTTNALNSGAAYARYCRTRETIWKQEEVESDNYTNEQTLNALDDETFVGMYELICVQHRIEYESRHAKAQRIIQMEKELDITETRRYTMDVLMDTDKTELTSVYDKVLSAHQHMSKLSEMNWYESNDHDDFDDEVGGGLVVFEGRA